RSGPAPSSPDPLAVITGRARRGGRRRTRARARTIRSRSGDSAGPVARLQQRQHVAEERARRAGRLAGVPLAARLRDQPGELLPVVGGELVGGAVVLDKARAPGLGQLEKPGLGAALG